MVKDELKRKKLLEFQQLYEDTEIALDKYEKAKEKMNKTLEELLYMDVEFLKLSEEERQVKIKEYDDKFYQSFFEDKNNIKKLNKWLNKFDDNNIIY